MHAAATLRHGPATPANMPGLPSQLGNLLSPRAYPHAVGNVEVLETARSWVLMAGEFAYLIGNPPAAGAFRLMKRLFGELT